MRFLRICLLVVLSLPAILHGQTNAVGTWKAVFVGPMGPRPQMVDDVIFSIEARGNGFTGTAKTEPEWPGVLIVSDVKLAGDKFSFIGTGKDGWTSNGQYHCCPRLAFAGTIKGDEMTLTMTWTSTERPDDPTATPLPMEAKRIKTGFSGTVDVRTPVTAASRPGVPETLDRRSRHDHSGRNNHRDRDVSGSRAHMPVNLVSNLDGSERTNIDRNSLPESQARRSRAAWRGAELVLTTTTPRLDATGAPIRSKRRRRCHSSRRPRYR